MAAREDGGPAGRFRLQGEFSARVFRARRALYLAFFSGTHRVLLLFFLGVLFFFCAAKCFSQIFRPVAFLWGC